MFKPFTSQKEANRYAIFFVVSVAFLLFSEYMFEFNLFGLKKAKYWEGYTIPDFCYAISNAPLIIISVCIAAKAFAYWGIDLVKYIASLIIDWSFTCMAYAFKNPIELNESETTLVLIAICITILKLLLYKFVSRFRKMKILTLLLLFSFTTSQAQLSPIVTIQNKSKTPKSIGLVTAKMYTEHVMTAFTQFTDLQPETNDSTHNPILPWVRIQKNLGYNLLWVYNDYYTGSFVTYNGNYYVCIATGSHGTAPSGTNEDNSNWKYLSDVAPSGVPVYSLAAYYDGGYAKQMNDLLNAAQIVGITVSPGCHGSQFSQYDVNMMLATRNHPAIYRVNGKPVYTYYAYSDTLYSGVLSLLPTFGMQRSDYILLANLLFPRKITYRPDLVQGYYGSPQTITTNPYREYNSDSTVYYDYWFWNGGVYLRDFVSSPETQDASDYTYANYSIDGAVNFGIGSLNTIISGNTFLANSAITYNKVSMAGINGFYASSSFSDKGYDGLAAEWDSILQVPASLRTGFVSDITANDYTELSGMTANLDSVHNGISYIPNINLNYFIGANTRPVLTDHSGQVKFLRPYIDAYKANADSITITQERIFDWYWAHPNDADSILTIPANVAALGSKFTQAWWQTTPYYSRNITASGINQIAGIRSQLTGYVNKIRMAAHMTSPGYLRINVSGNTYTSSLLNAGVNFFECPQALGTVTFSILNTNMSVRLSGTGSLPITNSSYPAAWNPLIEEVNYASQ